MSEEYDKLTKKELINLCKNENIKAKEYNKKNKKQLIELIKTNNT